MNPVWLEPQFINEVCANVTKQTLALQFGVRLIDSRAEAHLVAISRHIGLE